MANFSLASLTQMGLTLVLICWTTGSTGAAISFEEEFLQMKENYIHMKEIVKNLESKVNEMESKDAKMQEKVTELESKDVQMQEKDVQMQDKMTELEAKVQEQDSLLTSLLREKNERTKTISDFAPISTNQSTVAINGLPSSCGDLKMIGHTLNGFYSIVGSAMMESVYCDFSKLPSDPGFQKWIGYSDVKSAPVHFYVQRNSNFNTTGTPISFDLAWVNEGNAMDLTSGKFTAPRSGIYFFSFTALANLPASASSLGVSLFLNGGRIESGYVSKGINTAYDQWIPLSTLQATLNLKSGDQVWVQIDGFSYGAYLVDGNGHYTPISRVSCWRKKLWRPFEIFS